MPSVPQSRCGVAVIKLDRPLPAGSAANGKRPTRRVAIRAGYRKSPKRFATGLLGLAGGGVYPADDVTTVAVRSYRTFSPLPPAPTSTIRTHNGLSASLLIATHANRYRRIVEVGAGSAVCFLWHFPSGRPGWPLATTVPCPARTFLPTPTLRCSESSAKGSPSRCSGKAGRGSEYLKVGVGRPPDPLFMQL